jgi:ABC-2 type transport system permease protein
MAALRFLLVKDLQILRRSPLLVVLLALYAIVIGLPVGYAVSRPPSKPKVAFYNAVPPSGSTFDLGGESVDASKYADQLFDAIDPIRVKSRQAAIDKVKSGEAVAALIVPEDITDALQATIGLSGSPQKPTLEVFYNADNPIKRRYVEDTINAQVAKANQALGKELTKVAGEYLGILLKGGGFKLLGQQFDVLGLARSAQILQGIEKALPKDDPKVAALEQVRRFAQLAIDNLDLSGPVLGSISNPISVDVNTVGGSTSTLDGYAVAAAVTIALMFVGLLVAAGMLALEREEHAFGRLVRGLVGRTTLVAEKVLLGALVAAVIAVLLLLLLSLFQSVRFGRAPQWLLALGAGALGFGAMGVAIGALTRDVRASSLLAFLLSLPVAALALVPSGTISASAYDVVQVIGALFPFKPTLQALDAGLNDADPGLAGPVVHLAVLVLAYGTLARLGLRRFGART